MKVYILILLNLLSLNVFSSAAREKDNFPDGLLTEDKVYELTFVDFNKALRIVEEMRSRKSISKHQLDIVEGDLYFNTGRYNRALKYYRDALNSDSIRMNAANYMEQVHRMISCYDCLHNEDKKTQYVNILFQTAKKCGNKEMQSIALFNMGKTIYYQGKKKEGYRYMQEAIALMKKADYEYKYDNLRYNYNTLFVFQQRDGLYEEALKTLDELENVVAENTGKEIHMQGLNEKEKKALYANRAVVLSSLGRLKEAEHYYHLFTTIKSESDKDEYLIMPYLFDQKRYDDVIRMNAKREIFYINHEDTINYHMSTIKKSMGDAYLKKGNYEMAAGYFRQWAVLMDSIKSREQKSAALELATVYEMNEKEAQLQERDAELRIRNIFILSFASIVLLLGVLLYRVMRHNGIVRRKNMVLVGTVNEMLNVKDDLRIKNEEWRALKDEIYILKHQSPSLMEVNEEETTQESDEDAAEGEIVSAQDKELFERMQEMILNDQLYLQPDFNREKFVKMVRVPKNIFARLFKQCTGMGFTKYINNLRLEYAARMLLKYPDYTVNFIAIECGLPTPQTFYRLFLEKFGMTPAEFRSSLHCVDNEDSNE